jgi:hypothetical protein
MPRRSPAERRPTPATARTARTRSSVPPGSPSPAAAAPDPGAGAADADEDPRDPNTWDRVTRRTTLRLFSRDRVAVEVAVLTQSFPSEPECRQYAEAARRAARAALPAGAPAAEVDDLAISFLYGPLLEQLYEQPVPGAPTPATDDRGHAVDGVRSPAPARAGRNR